MSKITFRADDDLVRRLEALDASKSEVMREALRAYLDGADSGEAASDTAAVDSIDRQIERRVDAYLDRRRTPDVNVNVSLDDLRAQSDTVEPASDSTDAGRKTPVDEDESPRGRRCDQCGEEMASDHVYCPNCGEKANHRVFCECGDEVRSDWAFCPGCGRRTTAADVLDRP